MPQSSKQEQLRALLRPLSEQFTSQVAASIMSFVRDSVREEVEAVLGRALPAGFCKNHYQQIRYREMKKAEAKQLGRTFPVLRRGAKRPGRKPKVPLVMGRP